eukprot:TRINITY_DN1369_c0_g1_i1.p1 TRINITY_DN1369_c0_g1~~TRINITY_DN1369_c0_g1_i1.p1  ORF type:complete len:125 (-),score=41.61 TRINITY_DN1369_c0_g1_i1:49-423(-)
MVKYMIALDGSEGAQKAFEVALRLVKEGDSLTLVSVPKNASQSQAAETSLQKFRDICNEKSIQFEAVTDQFGDPRTVLCSLAESRQIDTLIVGTRGLSALKRLILGSVSSYVVEHATCDVVVAK